MKQRVISILDQNIGQETSRFTQQLAHALVRQSFRVLLIDANPNAHLSQLFSLQPDHGLADYMLNDVAAEQLMKPVVEGLSVISAGKSLADYEQLETGGLQRAKKLKQLLDQPIIKKQDFILITASENQGLLMINALFASTEVIAATACDFSSLQNTVQGVKSFKRLENVIGRNTKLWLALSQIGAASLHFEQIKTEILATFPSRVFKTVLLGNDVDDNKEASCETDYAALARDVVLGRTY